MVCVDFRALLSCSAGGGAAVHGLRSSMDVGNVRVWGQRKFVGVSTRIITLRCYLKPLPLSNNLLTVHLKLLKDLNIPQGKRKKLCFKITSAKVSLHFILQVQNNVPV